MIFIEFIISVKNNWNIDNMRIVILTDRSFLTPLRRFILDFFNFAILKMNPS